MIFGLTYYEIAEFFLVYSFLGWVTEVIYQAVEKGLVVNRGFLNGPVCPIYGFGVVGVFMLLHQVSERAAGGMENTSTLAVFIGGMILTTSIELIGGWALDKIFHARWWDYSNKPLNFRGYICLEFGIIWGLAIVFVVKEFHPFMEHLLNSWIPTRIGWILMAILYLGYLADWIVSVMILIGLNKKIGELDKMREDMRKVSDELSTRLGESAVQGSQIVQEAKVQSELARMELMERAAETREGLAQKREDAIAELEERRASAMSEFDSKRKDFYRRLHASRHFGSGRILRAFPQLETREHRELFEQIKKTYREMEDQGRQMFTK